MRIVRRVRRRRRVRAGMTMVELMVALIIIAVGVLGLSAGATLVTRLLGGGAMQARAAVTAQTRFEQLRATSCASIADGRDTVRGIISQWTTHAVTVSSLQRGMNVSLVVQYPTPRGTRSQTYQTMFPC